VTDRDHNLVQFIAFIHDHITVERQQQQPTRWRWMLAIIIFIAATTTAAPLQ
jgi:hypothetical protein